MTPYGIRYATNMSNYSYHCSFAIEDKIGVDAGFEDVDTWEKDNYDHATLGWYLGIDEYNGMTSMDWIKLETTKYSQFYNDQWDYRCVLFLSPSLPSVHLTVPLSHHLPIGILGVPTPIRIPK